MPIFELRSRIEAPASVVFAFHERPDALALLTPPWEKARVVERTPATGIDVGTRIVLELRLGPIPVRWVAEHIAYEPGRMFRDRSLAGPFRRWEHTHLVEPAGPDASVLVDHVEYALPFGPLGALLGGYVARRRLERMFAYRHEVTRRYCTARDV